MSSDGIRGNALLFLKALQVVRVILLFILSIDTANSESHYVFSIGSWYLFFFLAELPLLYSFLWMKSDWEMGARVYGLLWTFLLVLLLLLLVGYGGNAFIINALMTTIVIEVFVLAIPGSYWSNRSSSEGVSPID